MEEGQHATADLTLDTPDGLLPHVGEDGRAF